LTPADLQTTLAHSIQLRQGHITCTVEREIEGGIMSRKSCAALTAAMLSFALPAKAQQLPDGPGKELAEANCNSCHTLLSRVGSGYGEWLEHRAADDDQSRRSANGRSG
jgi:mono/diheme cytochrome c family protein